MKILIYLIVGLALLSCKKDVKEETCSDGVKNQDEVGVDCGGACGKCPIEYPESNVVGLPNILHENMDTLAKSEDYLVDYSLIVKLPEETSFWCKITKTSPSGVWFIADKYNLVSSNYTGSQTFTAIEPGTASVNLLFEGEGEAIITIHENGAAIASPTYTKTIVWQ